MAKENAIIALSSTREIPAGMQHGTVTPPSPAPHARFHLVPRPKLKILTLNTGLTEFRALGLPLYTDVPHVKERRICLATALRSIEADIVALQELPSPGAKRRLAAALADIYPFSAGITEDSRLYGAGLLVLARHPVKSAACTAFESQTVEERLFGPRGILACAIRIPGFGRCHLANLHATAGGARWRERSGAHGQKLSSQVTQAVSHTAAGSDGLFILAGDFNCGPTMHSHIYRRVIQTGFVDAVRAASGRGLTNGLCTWDSKNALNRRRSNGRAHRVDHVFLRPPERLGVQVTRAQVVLDAPMVPLPGGALVPVSDHYGLLVEIVRGTRLSNVRAGSDSDIPPDISKESRVFR